MINASITYLLLCVHLLGDFHFQSESLAQDKHHRLSSLFKHLLIHGLLLLPILILYFQQSTLYLIALIWVSHLIIDSLKWVIHQQIELSDDQVKILFVLDQILHLSIIVILADYVFATNDLAINDQIFKWALLIVASTKPANVSFKVLFSHFQDFYPPLKDGQTVPGAGATIGNLERILSAIFLSMNSLASIGLIYTAKSIARFKEIESNRGFAEYYLIGTLYSILYVLLVYLAIF